MQVQRSSYAMCIRHFLRLFFLLLVTFLSIGYSSAKEPIRLEIIAGECEAGLQDVIVSQILKSTNVIVTRQDPTHLLFLSCYWQMSPAGTTSMYSSWGNADLTVRIEKVSTESTIYAEAYSEGAKSRGIAMKKAAEKMVRELVKNQVFPRKGQ